MPRHTKVFLLVLAVFVFAGPLQLQADVTGKILGTASDPSGAVIACAEITAINAAGASCSLRFRMAWGFIRSRN